MARQQRNFAGNDAEFGSAWPGALRFRRGAVQDVLNGAAKVEIDLIAGLLPFAIDFQPTNAT